MNVADYFSPADLAQLDKLDPASREQVIIARMQPRELSRAEKEANRKARVSSQYAYNRSQVILPGYTEEQWRRYKSYENNLPKFLAECFPATVSLKPFGEQQVHAIKASQYVLTNGGRLCDAEPRGFAKSSRTIASAVWAMCYGKRSFTVIFSQNLKKSDEIFAAIKSELTTNDELADVFPNIIACFRAVEEKGGHRAAFQHINGVNTGIVYSSDRIMLPTILDFSEIPGYQNPARHEAGLDRGAACCAKPIGSARGLIAKNRITGELLRPDFVFLDDVQKDNVARSTEQIKQLMEMIKFEVLRLGGHSKTLSAIMTATVRKPDDVTDQFLKDPSWLGIRNKMLLSRAKNESLWLGKYKELRQNFTSEDVASVGRAKEAANEFYRANRKRMDAGCKVGWEWCYAYDDNENPEISAQQHAYNIIIDEGEDVFETECQNSPKRADSLSETKILSITDIQEKQHAEEEFIVPPDAHTITVGIDVQGEALYYRVAAFGDNFTGGFIHYGVWPPQPGRDFEYRSLRKKLSDVYPGMKRSARIIRALSDLADYLYSQDWETQEGEETPISGMLVDCGFETDAVHAFVRKYRKQNVRASKGLGVTSSDVPFMDRTVYKGERLGNHWKLRRSRKQSGPQFVSFDTNWWKTQYHEGLVTAYGDSGALTYFKAPPAYHAYAAENDASERPTQTTNVDRGVTIDIWKLLLNRDNHGFDAGILCFVMAAMCGVKFPEEIKAKRRTRVRKSADAEATPSDSRFGGGGSNRLSGGGSNRFASGGGSSNRFNSGKPNRFS